VLSNDERLTRERTVPFADSFGGLTYFTDIRVDTLPGFDPSDAS
jgi:hypothetical protein